MLTMKKAHAFAVALGMTVFLVSGAQSWARDYSAGEGGAAEIDACARDAAKFCHDEIMWQHEMEDCLRQHIDQVSKACRAQIQDFSFKKYYNEEAHPF